MMKVLCVRFCCGLMLSGLSAVSVAQSDIECRLPDQIFGATYQIVQQSVDANSAIADTETLRLLRSEDRVMHIHPNAHTADMWERNARGGVHFSRFYDSHKRGIEFYQGTAAEPSSQLSWDQAFQLVPATVLSENDVQTVQHMPGCATVETYAYTIAGENYILDWLPEQQLVLRLTLARGQRHLLWTLDSVATHPLLLSEEIQNRAAYIIIDYADLGDQESDPFFRSMQYGAEHH